MEEGQEEDLHYFVGGTSEYEPISDVVYLTILVFNFNLSFQF